MQAGKPAKASAQHQSRGARMRNHTRGKGQSCFLRGRVHRAQQRTTSETPAPGGAINADRSQAGKINHHAVVTGAETSEAVPSTTHRGQGSMRGAGTDRSLHLGNLAAAHNQSRPARHHAIPDATRGFIVRVQGTKQLAAKAPRERPVDLIGRRIDVSIHADRLSPAHDSADELSGLAWTGAATPVLTSGRTFQYIRVMTNSSTQ